VQSARSNASLQRNPTQEEDLVLVTVRRGLGARHLLVVGVSGFEPDADLVAGTEAG